MKLLSLGKMSALFFQLYTIRELHHIRWNYCYCLFLKNIHGNYSTVTVNVFEDEFGRVWDMTTKFYSQLV